MRIPIYRFLGAIAGLVEHLFMVNSLKTFLQFIGIHDDHSG